MIRSLTAISMILALPAIAVVAAPTAPAEKLTHHRGFATKKDAASKQDPATPCRQPKKPLVKKISADVYQIGKVTLNKKTREISFPAYPNIVEAGTPLEFLLVHLNGEKVHESLLITEADPTNLNIALKLLSYKESQELFRPITEDGSRGELYQKEPDDIRKAARFTIHVTWKDGAKSKSTPITQWLKHRITNKSMPDTPWVYNGSYIHNKAFKAKLNGNFFAIFPNESAIANFPGAKDVDRYDDTLWISAPNLPREGTKITIDPQAMAWKTRSPATQRPRTTERSQSIMKTIPLFLTLALPLTLPLAAQTKVPSKENPYLSIQLEMKRAIERGNEYLKKEQNKEGYWREPKYPAFTALALTAAMRSPSHAKADYIDTGFTWLLKQQKDRRRYLRPRARHLQHSHFPRRSCCHRRQSPPPRHP